MEHEELKENNTRYLSYLMEDIGDILAEREELDSSQRALAEIAADIGFKIRAIDGGRVDYDE